MSGERVTVDCPCGVRLVDDLVVHPGGCAVLADCPACGRHYRVPVNGLLDQEQQP